ncbi:uncharacterized protein LOC117059399 isoform X2 [Lacerta agilis]|uniref:uncharacterized protein LOC117059399 isoform X2 n=1 Tax=Lacerta agilis TaxID=80427 RepID=UPI00141A61F8|nr:uncharacterized protein LOC117059399 isoform X2 [Lacerta agilis]
MGWRTRAATGGKSVRRRTSGSTSQNKLGFWGPLRSITHMFPPPCVFCLWSNDATQPVPSPSINPGSPTLWGIRHPAAPDRFQDDVEVSIRALCFFAPLWATRGMLWNRSGAQGQTWLDPEQRWIPLGTSCSPDTVQQREPGA